MKTFIFLCFGILVDISGLLISAIFKIWKYGYTPLLWFLSIPENIGMLIVFSIIPPPLSYQEYSSN